VATDPQDGHLTARWRRLAFPVLAIAGVMLLFSALSEVLNPVLIAVLLAVILNPVVNAAGRMGTPRVLTVSLLYVLLLVGMTLTGSVLVRQFTQLGRALAGEPFHGDLDDNGLIERSEATGQIAERFGLFDENGSGVLNGAELIRGSVNDVYLPGTTYRDKHTVTLGGKRVMMVHLGTAHTDDGSVLYFPDERTVFSADVLQVKRLPQNITPTIGAYIDALRTIMALDFDHAATGHALMGTKKDAAMSLQYLEDLATGVAAGIGAGRSLQEIQKTLTLDAYKGFERWDTHRTIHIAQAYAVLKGTPPAGATRTN